MDDERSLDDETQGTTGDADRHRMGGDPEALEGPDRVGPEYAMDPNLTVDDGPYGEDMGPADAPLDPDDPRLGSG